MMNPGKGVARAATILRRGGIVAYATEAVFGIGCDPRNRRAVERVRKIKQRSVTKGFILIAADVVQLRPYVTDLPPQALASWPGPRTWLLAARPGIAHWITGRSSSIAVRVTAHRQAAALCRAARIAIVSTSANRSRQRPARTRAEVLRRFGRLVDYVLSGQVGNLARPTTIIDAGTGCVVRPG